MTSLATHLPLLRARARSGPVTLAIPDFDDLATLADALAAGGIDDDQTRSSLAWNPASPVAAARSTISQIATLATAPPGPEWALPLVVFVDGFPIGRQDVRSHGRFSELRVVETGSWLLNTHRGRGYGTHARAAALSLCWAFGAEYALTSWRADNAASAAVSGKLGYRDNGVDWCWDRQRRCRVELRRALVTEADFHAAWPHPVELFGIDDAMLSWLQGDTPPPPLDPVAPPMS